MQSLIINEYNSLWMLKNYLSCVYETETSVKKLISHMENDQ